MLIVNIRSIYLFNIRKNYMNIIVLFLLNSTYGFVI